MFLASIRWFLWKSIYGTDSGESNSNQITFGASFYARHLATRAFLHCSETRKNFFLFLFPFFFDVLFVSWRRLGLRRLALCWRLPRLGVLSVFDKIPDWALEQLHASKTTNDKLFLLTQVRFCWRLSSCSFFAIQDDFFLSALWMEGAIDCSIFGSNRNFLDFATTLSN